MLKDFLATLAESALNQCVDPEPVQLGRRDRAGALRLTREYRAALAQNFALSRPIALNQFLLGCLMLTDQLTQEHLIVGFGHQSGPTTMIGDVSRVGGARHSVAIPADVQVAIVDHVHAAHANAVVVLHNHPRSFLNLLLDNYPMASHQDRRTAIGYVSQPMILAKLLMGGGAVRQYLVENGFVREFFPPALGEILRNLIPTRAGEQSAQRR